VVNGSNDPLSANVGVTLQNQYVASYYANRGADGNTLALQGTWPHDLGGLPQILEVSVPIVTSPDGTRTDERARRRRRLRRAPLRRRLVRARRGAAGDGAVGDGRSARGRQVASRLTSAAVLPHEIGVSSRRSSRTSTRSRTTAIEGRRRTI
jgi:hypothetical protein